MKSVLCVSVALKECRRITDKAYVVMDWSGNETILPAQFVIMKDYDKSKEESERWWIAKWILEKKTEEGKGIAWGVNRTGWWNPVKRQLDVVKHVHVEIEHHVPAVVAPDSTPVSELAK